MSIAHRWDSGVEFAAATDVTPLRWTNVEDYGAVGDGIADDTAAINAAAAVANAVTTSSVLWFPLGVLHFPAGKTYRTTAGLDPWLCNVMAIGAKILFDPAVTSAGIAVSLGTDAYPSPEAIIAYLPTVRKNVTYWSSSLTGTDVGIRMIGIRASEIHIGHVRGFSIGVLATGGLANVAFAWNSVHIRMLDNNKINLKISDGGAGYANENTWFLGQLSMDSNFGTNITGARHIFLEATPTVQSVPNNNRFYGGSIEGDGPQWQVEVNGCYNAFYNMRWEAVHPKAYFNGAIAVGNLIHYGYRAHAIEFTQANGAFDNHVMTEWFMALEGGAGASGVIRVANTTGNSSPAVSVADASLSPMTANMATGWRTALSGDAISAKALADTDFAVRLNTSGKVEFGNRAGAVTNTIHAGAGTPEASVTANPGSLYLRSDGGVARSIYVKTTGTGNTGWGAASLVPTATSYSDTNITPNADYAYHAWTVTTTRTVGAPTATEPFRGQKITFDITNTGAGAVTPTWNAAFKLASAFSLKAA